MQSVWQINNKKKLLLFFSGWGMDERPTAHLNSAEYDICTCFNYNKLDTPEIEKWQTYDEIIVAGWSMGVWAAEQVMPNIGISIRKAVAINGTPVPVDDRLGIPAAIAQGTLDGLNPASLNRFYRRMFGNVKLLQKMKEQEAMPVIDLEERQEELRKIIHAAPYTETGFCWDKAVISLEDLVFPPAGQAAYWRTCPKTEGKFIIAPHYPFHLFTSWEEIIGE